MVSRNINVVDRGSFFEDGFFKENWADFDSAMRSVLDRYDKGVQKEEKTSGPECRDLYRKVRKNEIEEDMYASQAILVTEKDGRFQVVMDVKDFNPRDLQVRVVDERIKVEGRIDLVSEDGKESTSKAFYKEFTLPVQADIDQLSTALSKDGVLTIKAPKKEEPIGIEPRRDPSLASGPNRLDERPVNSPSFESTHGMDNFQKDMRDRLNISDRDSGRSSGTGSPIQSMYSTTSCGSPAPSEAWSSVTDQDRGGVCDQDSRNPSSCFSPTMSPLAREQCNRPYGQFPSNNPMPSNTFGYPPNFGMGPSFGQTAPVGQPQSQFSPGNPSPFSEQHNPQMFQYPNRNPQSYNNTNMPHNMAVNPMNTQAAMAPRAQKGPSAAVGSGGTATISVKEDDGKRTLTQETTSLVQEKDGYLQSKEVTAEITDKESQAARREATTRMTRQEEDKDGRFKHSETADASDVNESCVRTMPDGSVMTVKKSSVSSSNYKTSFSSAMPNSVMGSGFPKSFGDPSSMMQGGNQLMHQMSTDSMMSRSSFPEMPSMNQFQRMSDFQTPSNLPQMPGFSSRMPMFQNNPFPGQASPFGGHETNFSNNHYSTSQSQSSRHSNETTDNRRRNN